MNLWTFAISLPLQRGLGPVMVVGGKENAPNSQESGALQRMGRAIARYDNNLATALPIGWRRDSHSWGRRSDPCGAPAGVARFAAVRWSCWQRLRRSRRG